MRARLHTVAVASMAALVLSGCSKEQPEAQPVVAVQVASAKKVSLQQAVTAEAVLFPKNEAAITPKVIAPVSKFYVNRGSRVHKGELLAILENRDISASVAESKGALEQAQAQYETTTQASVPEDVKKAELDAKAAKESLDAQQKLYDSRSKLFQQGALPRKELDAAAVALAQARAQSDVAQQHLASLQAVGKQAALRSAAGLLTSAEGKYKGAQAQLSYSEIRSPMDGVVTDRPVWPGETPPSGTPLLTIMDISSVVARAHIPQEQAALLKPGDLATITAADVTPVPGKVIIVSPALDAGSTTVQVWVEADGKSGALRPGSTVELKIVARTIEGAIAIPQQALLKSPEGATAVMVVDNRGKAHKREVMTGIEAGGLIQITKGLQPGEIVVTTGAYGLPDGTQVQAASGRQNKNASSPGTTD
ncbi:MAG TPA: efflux RND transporter periplasmic adaptor subunit [Terriglobales bacterium]|nr:efflux RND transporter periplasmic adaptor subunit [Terriglobales bacterium]